jgi:site-specific recombinase XerC
MIMLLLDTGARRAELVDLKLAHVDLDLDVLLVLGKGRRERAPPFGHKAGAALDRYLGLSPWGCVRPGSRSAGRRMAGSCRCAGCWPSGPREPTSR